MSKICTRSGFWWGSFNYAMRKGNLIIFLQNEQVSIRNTREIHGIGPNSEIFKRLVFPKKFNQFSHPMTRIPHQPSIWVLTTPDALLSTTDHSSNPLLSRTRLPTNLFQWSVMHLVINFTSKQYHKCKITTTLIQLLIMAIYTLLGSENIPRGCQKTLLWLQQLSVLLYQPPRSRPLQGLMWWISWSPQGHLNAMTTAIIN